MSNEKVLVPSSRPDIDEEDIARVAAVLRSGWITTGPQVEAFEAALALKLGGGLSKEASGSLRVVCLSSATAGLELVLRALGVGAGDEVITTAYTYAATANAIRHTGARAVLADTLESDFAIDPRAVAKAITPRTKAIIPVDFAGWLCDYALLAAAACGARAGFTPANPQQEAFGRPVILADAAHSFGARYEGEGLPRGADFAVYSFHAVKNLTTAEGGAVAFRDFPAGAPGKESADCFARALRLLALHGQTKDALAKTRAGNWEYDIEVCGYKHNMTDIQAALGLGQLARYDAQLARRREIAERYAQGLSDARFLHPEWAFTLRGNCGRSPENELPNTGVPARSRAAGTLPLPAAKECSYHLYPLRIAGYGEPERNALIARLAEAGIAANVHYKPLPLFTAYRGEYRMEEYPRAWAHYEREITLPLWTGMSDEQIDWVVAKVLEFA